MGLIIEVYRHPDGDFTNRGISSTCDRLCLVNVDGPFEPTAKRHPAMLITGNLPGTVKIVPAILCNGKWLAETRWTMMGGNYGASSDSRFSEAVHKLTGHPTYSAVPIHDRLE